MARAERRLYEIKADAAGATPPQWSRLVDAVMAEARHQGSPFPSRMEAMIDASLTLQVLERAGLVVADKPSPELEALQRDHAEHVALAAQVWREQHGTEPVEDAGAGSD